MGSNDISLYTLKEVVASLGHGFSTKDVSEDIRMKQAHPNLKDQRNYHAFVGRALSEHRAQLEIDEVQKNTSRGSRWKKI